MKKIFFIEDSEGTATFWKEEGEDSNGLFEIVHFWDPFSFFEFLSSNEIPKDSYIVADMLGDGFNNSSGFSETCKKLAPYHEGLIFLVSNNFLYGSANKIQGFDFVYCKQEALRRITERLRNEH